MNFTGDPDGPTDRVLCRADDDPDTLWAFEFYKDDASFERHFNDPQIDANHDEIIELLAAPPVRVLVRPVFPNSPADPTNRGPSTSTPPTHRWADGS